jgi:hypothetical protein
VQLIHFLHKQGCSEPKNMQQRTPSWMGCHTWIVLASGNLPMEYTVKLMASSQTVFKLAEDRCVVMAPKAV